jgi:hypothetical protein
MARRTRSGSILLFSFAALAWSALGCSPSVPSVASCGSSSDCTGGRTCVDGRCVAPTVRDGSVDGAAGDGGDTGLPGLDGAMMDLDGGAGDLDSGGADLDGAMMMMPDGSGWSMDDDSDGDGITDFHEGRGMLVDTDGDGTPDYLDDDSDGDGISDATESGDASLTTPPSDTDADRTPDFRDADSDGNGVPDSIEGESDIDGDGRPAFRDTDNDGDLVSDATEIGADPSSPTDTNGDGTPDYVSLDSDGDTISDLEESLIDTDADGLVDMRDLDTDGDGWLDSVEAGDASLGTPAVDTDGDTIADFRDTDSDGDGLSDEAERGYGTSRTDADTDHDGVSDLIEVGAGTRPLDPTDSPRTRGDFVFLEPYMMPPSPTRDTLQFSTNLQRADVYFLMDNTGSMSGTVAGLQAGLTTGTLVPGCSGGVIGAIQCSIPEAWFGVGGFDDYPVGGFGQPGYSVDALGISHDLAFFQYSAMSMSTATTSTAVGRYRVNYGVDGPESGLAALYGLAARDTLSGYSRFATGTTVSTTPPACAAGGRGAACFRADAVPIIIMMTDVDQHNSPTCGCNYSTAVPGGGPTYASTIAQLTALNARVVGIDTGGASVFLNRLITDTTIARGATGAASEYVISAPGGSGLTGTIVELVRRAAAVPLDVSARAHDLADPGESVDAVLAFLDHLETRTTAASGLTCTTGFVTLDGAGIDSDTYPDTFQNVTPGAPVCFDIVPKMNTTVMQTLVPQLFRAQIDVIGDGFTPLDDRIIYFLVPPRIPDPNE